MNKNKKGRDCLPHSGLKAGMKPGIGQAAVIFVAALMALSAQGVAEEAHHPDESLDAQLVEKGKELYYRHCVHCHGINMINPGTISFDLRQFPQDDKARFVRSVTLGKNDRMPPWGDILLAQEVEQLWAYVRSGGKS
jgi:mono/diheme cytochrome c family protein